MGQAAERNGGPGPAWRARREVQARPEGTAGQRPRGSGGSRGSGAASPGSTAAGITVFVHFVVSGFLWTCFFSIFITFLIPAEACSAFTLGARVACAHTQCKFKLPHLLSRVNQENNATLVYVQPAKRRIQSGLEILFNHHSICSCSET